MVNETDSPDLPRPIQHFLDVTLPKKSKNHTLALGEAHNDTTHVRWLTGQLERLKNHHQLGSLGLEMPPCFNVLFWAYEDGTLARKLGSADAARKFMTAAMISSVHNDCKSNAPENAALITNALDKGIRVVAFDGRDSYAYILKNHQPYFEEIPEGYRNQLLALEPKQLVETLRGQPFTWLIQEIDLLLQENPAYQKRLNLIEGLATAGKKKIDDERIGYDGLAACLFESMAVPNKNRITLSGSLHNEGLKDPDYGVEGTFGHQLQVLAQANAAGEAAPKVTRAVIGSTGMIADVKKLRERDLRYKTSAKGAHIPVVNLDTTTISHLPNHSPPTQTPLGEHLVPEQPLSDSPDEAAPSLEEHRQRFTNPLLIPDIKRAADAVRVMMNGPEKGITP